MFVAVPPSQVIIYDSSGRELGDVVGPLEEGQDLLLKCEVRGGKEPPNFWIFVYDMGDLTLADSTSSFQTEAIQPAANFAFLTSLFRHLALYFVISLLFPLSFHKLAALWHFYGIPCRKTLSFNLLSNGSWYKRNEKFRLSNVERASWKGRVQTFLFVRVIVSRAFKEIRPPISSFIQWIKPQKMSPPLQRRTKEQETEFRSVMPGLVWKSGCLENLINGTSRCLSLWLFLREGSCDFSPSSISVSNAFSPRLQRSY